jgi:exoribonuclease R
MEMPLSSTPTTENLGAEISDYVAHLQLHMALQARNLTPNVMDSQESLPSLLRETQAQCEKLSSRQRF